MAIKCIEFKNSADIQDLYFYGDIVSDAWQKWTDTDTCPEDVQTILAQIDQNKPLNIYINSGGGSVFAGVSIYNMLKRCNSQKTVYVDALAASIASIIAMAGDKIIIPSNSFLMIHKPWNIIGGNANDMRKMADDLDRIEEGLLNVYSEKLADGVSVDTIKQMMDDETWLNGIEAAKYFNVEVVQANNATASISKLDQYKNVPKCLTQQEDEGCQCETCNLKENCNPNSDGCQCENCNVEDCNKLAEDKAKYENLKAQLELELLM